MKILLDTHAFLWWIADDARLSTGCREMMADGRNQLLLSAASGWEIAIKAGLGRLTVPEPLSRFLVEQMHENCVEALPIHLSHALHVQTLPLHHCDPFDRMLIAQAQIEGIPILTADEGFAEYDVAVMW